MVLLLSCLEFEISVLIHFQKSTLHVLLNFSCVPWKKGNHTVLECLEGEIAPNFHVWVNSFFKKLDIINHSVHTQLYCTGNRQRDRESLSMNWSSALHDVSVMIIIHTGLRSHRQTGTICCAGHIHTTFSPSPVQ